LALGLSLSCTGVLAADHHDHGLAAPEPAAAGHNHCCSMDQVPGIGTLIDSAATAPALALNPRQGTVYVAWISRGEVLVMRRERGGAAFEAPVRAARTRAGDEGQHPPLLSVGAEGTLYLGWAGGKGPALSFCPSADGGRSFGPVQTLGATSGSAALFPAMAVGPDGGLYASWITEAGALCLARSTDGGKSWSPAREVDGQVLAGPTSLTFEAAGRLYLAWWEKAPDGTAALALSQSIDRGRTFSPPVQVPAAVPLPGLAAPTGPSLLADELGRVFLAWSRGREEGQGAFWAMAQRDLHFGPPIPLAVASGIPLLDPNLAASGGGRVQLAGVAGGFVYLALRSSEAQENQPLAPGQSPSLASAGGTIALAWKNGPALRTYILDQP
jgi:hypothetical protein